jgi:hypothetical protein
MLTGRWTYRSFRNDPEPIGNDAAAALHLLLSEGVMEFGEAAEEEFRGGLGLASDHALTLMGRSLRAADGREEYSIVGHGIAGTPTEGWRYDFRCSLAPTWPGATDRLPPLLGSVLRVTSHGSDAPAGETACFIAVRRTGPIPAGRFVPRNALTAGL